MTPATPNKLRLGYFRYRMWADKNYIYFQVLEQHNIPENTPLTTADPIKRVEAISNPEILSSYLFLQGTNPKYDQTAVVKRASYNAEREVNEWKQALTQLTIE